MNTASKTRHVFILFLADIVWGIAFVAQSKGGDAVGAFSFNGIRVLIGALGHKNTGEERADRKQT